MIDFGAGVVKTCVGCFEQTEPEGYGHVGDGSREDIRCLGWGLGKGIDEDDDELGEGVCDTWS